MVHLVRDVQDLTTKHISISKILLSRMEETSLNTVLMSGLILKKECMVGSLWPDKLVTHLVILLIILRPAYMIWGIVVYQVDIQ